MKAAGLALVLPYLLTVNAASLNRRATAALAQLVTGSNLVTTGCTTTCAAMVASAGTCTEDICACAADAQVQACFECTVADATLSASQLTQTKTSYNVYMANCLAEGNIQAPLQVDGITLTGSATGVAATTSSSASSSTTSISSRSSSSSAATSASVTTTALTAAASSATTVYTLMTSFVNSVYSSDCTTQCTAFTSDYYNCANDGCVCTTATIQDFDTCQNCIASDTNAFSTSQLATLKSYWTRAITGCVAVNAAIGNINTATVTGAGTATKATTGTAKTTTGAAVTNTGIPVQSYYAPTTTIKPTTTSGVAAAVATTANASGVKSSAVAVTSRSWGLGMVVGLVGIVMGGTIVL